MYTETYQRTSHSVSRRCTQKHNNRLFILSLTASYTHRNITSCVHAHRDAHSLSHSVSSKRTQRDISTDFSHSVSRRRTQKHINRLLTLSPLNAHTKISPLAYPRTHSRSQPFSHSHAHTHCLSVSLFHPCSPILPPTPTLVLDSVHTHLLSGREGGGERSLLSLVCVSSGVCPSVPACAMNIWPRNRCASSGASDSLIKGGEP